MEKSIATTAAPRNRFFAVTSWAQLCKLSVRMTNGLAEEAYRPDLVYVAENSVGDREVEAAEPVDKIDNGFGNWGGFSEDGAIRFLWGSGSSGATIEATCKDGSWALVFQGCDTSDRAESCYVRDFALAANLDTLELVKLADRAAIGATLSSQVGWLSSTGDAAGVAKLREFVTMLGITIPEHTNRW